MTDGKLAGDTIGGGGREMVQSIAAKEHSPTKLFSGAGGIATEISEVEAAFQIDASVHRDGVNR